MYASKNNSKITMLFSSDFSNCDLIYGDVNTIFIYLNKVYIYGNN